MKTHGLWTVLVVCIQFPSPFSACDALEDFQLECAPLAHGRALSANSNLARVYYSRIWVFL